jgi:hypothetical protein
MFWWRTDSTKYGGSFLKYWRLKKALNEGLLDFYTRIVLIVGGTTILYGVYRGNKRSGGARFQEKVNELKLADLDLELQRIKLLIELDEIEDDMIN